MSKMKSFDQMTNHHVYYSVRRFPQKQKGVALLMVIFVFALVTVLSVGMFNRQSLFLKQAGNVNAHTQAYHYALAAEAFAIPVSYTHLTLPTIYSV